jgi:hypothetical protein
MMGFLGMGNNPMVGATVVIAVAIQLPISQLTASLSIAFRDNPKGLSLLALYLVSLQNLLLQ